MVAQFHFMCTVKIICCMITNAPTLVAIMLASGRIPNVKARSKKLICFDRVKQKNKKMNSSAGNEEGFASIDGSKQSMEYSLSTTSMVHWMAIQHTMHLFSNSVNQREDPQCENGAPVNSQVIAIQQYMASGGSTSQITSHRWYYIGRPDNATLAD